MNKTPWSLTVPLLALLAPLALADTLAHSLADTQAPSAARGAHHDRYHGISVADPYRWLEDTDSEATRAWLDDQVQWLERWVDPGTSAALQTRIAGLTAFEAYSSPIRAGERYFFIRFPPTQASGAVFVQTGLEGNARLLLDPRSLERENLAIVGIAPSRDGEHVAYQLAEGRSSWRSLRIRSVTRGTDLEDRLEGLHRMSGAVSWRPDGSGFYYLSMDPPAGDQPVGQLRVRFHRLGTDQSEDLTVYSRDDHPGWLLTQRLSWDGRYLLVIASEGGSPHTRVFLRDERHPEAGFTTLFGEGEATYTFLGAIGERLWFHTTRDAPRGRIVAIDLPRPGALIEIVPEAEDAIAGGSLVGGNAVALRGQRLLITYVRDARPYVRIHDLEGAHTADVALPDIGAIWGGFTGNPEDTEVFYRFISLSDPNTVYRLDAISGRSTVFKRPELPFDPSGFVTSQVFYTSRDGTRVPMFVSHRKDLDLDGSAPAFMYGYGAWGWIAFPWYQPQVLALMQQGWVYALPGIRGGGEYGQSWHQAGIRRNKQNAIDDYVHAARWLIDNDYTSADRLVANGGSASGALAAAAVLQRPDLFAAGVIDIPTLDILRYDQLTPTRHAWTSEIGSIEDPDDFRALLAYSPYHNIQPGRCYPPMLILVGEGDELAPPPHGYKFTAAMQHAHREAGCDHPVALKLIPGAGHSHGPTPAAVARTWADAISFLKRQIGGGRQGEAP